MNNSGQNQLLLFEPTPGDSGGGGVTASDFRTAIEEIGSTGFDVEVDRIRRSLVLKYNNRVPGEEVPSDPFIAACLQMINAQIRVSKGLLAVVLHTTIMASRMTYPLDPDAFFATNGSGQVKDLNGPKVNGYLREWMVEGVFGSQGGRTNNGSMGQCREWVATLNRLYEEYGYVAHGDILLFWMELIEKAFAAKPISVPFNPKHNVRLFSKNLVEQVRDREKRDSGARMLGTVMQHMVGAKLSVMLGEEHVEHHHSNQADVQFGRDGDFSIGDWVFHVTSDPSAGLIDKCRKNVNGGMRPLIVTLSSKAEKAKIYAEDADLDNEIEVIEFEDFIAMGAIGMSLKSREKPVEAVRNLISVYNEIIAEYENASGLVIELS